jgi:hypothetical protein
MSRENDRNTCGYNDKPLFYISVMFLIVCYFRYGFLYQSSQLLTLMAGFHELAGVILLTT